MLNCNSRNLTVKGCVETYGTTDCYSWSEVKRGFYKIHRTVISGVCCSTCCDWSPPLMSLHHSCSNRQTCEWSQGTRVGAVGGSPWRLLGSDGWCHHQRCVLTLGVLIVDAGVRIQEDLSLMCTVLDLGLLRSTPRTCVCHLRDAAQGLPSTS